MTEAEIQDYLYRHCFARQYSVPNIYLYSWESDFLSVTRAGRVHEYEIKVTKADFAADAGKVEKHQIMETGFRDLNQYERMKVEDKELRGWEIPEFITTKMTADKRMPGKRPNYFWYVCPDHVTETVPNYAGLIYCKPYLKIVKEAPLLHKEKITDTMEKKILTAFYYRYWKIRREVKNKDKDRAGRKAAE
jgi:hypothetical protein